MKYILFSLLFVCSSLSGQIKLKDLNGSWICDNTNSIYYKSDTIKFFQAQLHNQSTFNNRMNDILGCSRIGWVLKRKKLIINIENLCVEPPTTTSFIQPWKLKIVNKNSKHYIEITHVTELAEVFHIVNYTKMKISEKEKDFAEEFEKTLVLKRIR